MSITYWREQNGPDNLQDIHDSSDDETMTSESDPDDVNQDSLNLEFIFLHSDSEDEEFLGF